MSNFCKRYHSSFLLFSIITLCGGLCVYAKYATKHSAELSSHADPPTALQNETPMDLSGPAYLGNVCIKDPTGDYEGGGDWNESGVTMEISADGSFWLKSSNHVPWGGWIHTVTRYGSNVGKIRVTRVGTKRGVDTTNWKNVNWGNEEVWALRWGKDNSGIWLTVKEKRRDRRFRFSTTGLRPPCRL